MPTETRTFERADDTGLDDPAAQQAALFTLQALYCPEDVLPPQNVSKTLAQGRKWLAAMAQLWRVRAEQDALEATQKVSQKTLSVAAEVLHDSIERFSRQQLELAGRDNENLWLLSCTTLIPLGRRAAPGLPGTDESHPLPFKRPRAS